MKVFTYIISYCDAFVIFQNKEGGRKMLGNDQFKKLQEYKKLGVSKLKVSEKLNLSYKTVWNWWDRDEDFFNKFQKEHEFILDNYRKYIIEVSVKDRPSLSMKNE